MIKKIKCFTISSLFTLLLLISGSVFAQKRITGKIINPETSQPISGATLQIKGTSTATQTAADGSFAISTTETNPTLVVSSVGFEQQEIPLRNQNNVTVSLKSTTASLSEVVVTGYTAQRKKEITGAVAVVRTGDLTKVSSPSFQQQLEGRASGVTVTTSGSPGAGASVRIRGTSTFTQGGGEPLIVIDGVQMRGAFQQFVNPNDIESMQVLKDAATTAAYGIGANNGVIIITTKKGKTGQAKVEYSGSYGVQSAIKSTNDFMLGTAKEYADLIFQAYTNGGQWPQAANSIIGRTYGIGSTPVLPEYVFPLPDSAGAPVNLGTYNVLNNPIMRASPGTNWWDAIFRKAPQTEQNISVSGGTDKGRYFFSVNYFNQQGTMRYTDYKKYTTRANTEFKVKAFTFGENMTVGFSNAVGQPSGNQVEQSVINEGILKMQPIIPVYDVEGGWGGTRAGFGNGKNGLARLYRNKDNRGESFRLLGNVYGEVRFLNHFTGRINYGIDYSNDFSNSFTFVDYESNERIGANGFSENTQRSQRWIFSQQLTYDNQFGDHTVRATAVHEAQLNKFRQIGGSLNNYFLEQQSLWYLNTALADPSTRSVSSSGTIDNAKESYLGRVEYGFKGRYLINATARYDQSSNFALEKGQLFGGVGLAWRVSDEAFMQSATWVSDLKLRAAYGVTGNDAIPGTANYSSYGGLPGTTFYDINGTNTSAVTGYTATQFGVPVRWEKQKQIDIGVDAFFLSNRLEISVDYYKRQNADFLFQPDVPGTFPYDVGKPFRNIGSLSNKGVEFSGTWRAGVGKDFKYDATLNLTFNKNRIDELAPELGVTSFFPSIPESRIGPLVRHYQGQPMSTFYGYTLDGIYQNQAEVDKGPQQTGKQVGRFRWKDISGPEGKPDGKIDDNDKGPIGDPNPRVVFGFNLNLSYKNFDFTMFLQGTQGNEIFNYSRWFTDFFAYSGNRSKRMLYESWTPTRTNAKLPLLDITDNYSTAPSTYYVEDGSYLRARVLQLGYRLPAKVLSRVGIDNARIYVQGQNLFTITKYSGLDPTLGTRDNGNAPEQWSGVDYANYPSSKVIMVGVNVGF